MNRLHVWWADSRGKVIAVLFILAVSALIHQFRLLLIWHIGIALVLTIVFDLVLGKLTRGKVSFSLSSAVSGFLIGLIFDPTAGTLPVVSAALLASVSKYFLRTQSDKHIFNPAAFGILVASLLFHRPVAWWGVSWGFIPILFIALGMSYVLYHLRRLTLPISFLTIYFLINFIFSGFESAWRLTIDGTVFLFAFIMLPEPVTSLARGRWRYLWGVLVGVLVIAQGFLGISFTDPLLLALLTANLVGFFFVRNRPITP